MVMPRIRHSCQCNGKGVNDCPLILIAVITALEVTEFEVGTGGGTCGAGAKHHGWIGIGNDLIALIGLFHLPFHAVCHRSRAQNNGGVICGGIAHKLAWGIFAV